MDKFEKFIKENRMRIDTGNLDDSQWEKIAESFSQYNRRKNYWRLSIAAGIIVILTLGTLLFRPSLKQNEVPVRTSVLDGVSTFYRDEEISSIKLINGVENELRKQKIPVEYEDMFRDFTNQLQIIDKQYEIYKTEIEKNGYTHELIQQVIYNYQLKLSVLQMFQNEIDKINNLTKDRKDGNKKIQFNI